MKVVVGYDGSEDARRALQRASILASGDPVIVVSVVPLSGPAGRGPAGVDTAQLEAHHEQLEQANTFLTAQGVEAQLITTFGNSIGDAADALMHVARDHQADVIIVGTRGLGGLKRLVLGSVSSKLVHEAPCDVLVVR